MQDTQEIDQSQVSQQYVFKPQPGKQTDFLSSSADIVIYGGGAGSGKTYASLLEGLRHHNKKNVTVGIFRRDRARLTNPGGMWDESYKIYPHFGAKTNQQLLRWTFKSGAVISMHGLQHEHDVHKYHGSQFTVLLFDELTEFEQSQFWYMLSRNRSDTGISGYVRATCNPDCESWVKDLIQWYLQPDGYPDHSKSGVIRWFCRINDELFWAPSKEQLIADYQVTEIDCKSFTFIPATIEDNQILLQNDPRYVSNLRAMGEVEKQRLLFGNWNIKAEGKIFKQKDFMVFTRVPAGYTEKMIFVDTAQKTKEANDWTVMQAWIKWQNKIYLIDQVRGRFEYPDLKQMFAAFCAKHSDAKKRFVEDAVSGTALIQDMRRSGVLIDAIIRSKDKYTRAYDCQGWIQGGYVFLNAIADYYTDLMSELTSFSSDDSHKHDDQVDCMLDAITKMLIEAKPNKSNLSNKSLTHELV